MAFLKTPEVAELLNVSISTVHRLAKGGELPAYSIDRHLRFDADELEEWIKTRRNDYSKGNEQLAEVNTSEV
jgi:excisionase family DNA binding protein